MTFEHLRSHQPNASAAAAERALAAAKSYQLARRHSVLVRFLRAAIPIAAVVSFSVFIVFPFINPFRSGGVSVGAIKMDGTRVTMENPRLAGHRKDNRPYEVTADSAVQDIRVPNVIELRQMKARVVNADGSVLNLTAGKAIFDSQKEQLQMREDVRLITQNGQEALMPSADVDFKAGTVRSREGVRVRLPDMSVSADELDVVDSGGKIAFTGRVTAVVDDMDSKPATGQPALDAQRPAQPPASPSQTTPGAATTPTANRGAPSSLGATARDVAARDGPARVGPERGAGSVTIIDPISGRVVARPAP